MNNKKEFYTVQDVQQKLDRKENCAYAIIRKLNKELEAKGILTIRGKVNAKYFDERFNL